MSTLTSSFNIVLQVLARAIRRENEIKEVNLSLFADYLILYIVHPKEPTRKKNTPVLELINEFSKILGQNIQKRKSTIFLYTDNERPRSGIKKIISFQ